MIWPFYLMAVVAVISTLRVVTNTSPVHALLNLIVSLLAIAGIFFMVGAPFAGVLEIIVYAGAIMVLFVFVVMMLNLGHQTHEQEKRWLSSDILAVPTMLTCLMGIALIWMMLQGPASPVTQLGHHYVGPVQVGTSLFKEYFILVEVSALLLLAALVAAFHIGKRDDDTGEQR